MKHGKISDFCTVIAGQSPKGSSYNDCGNGLEFHQGKKAFGDSILEFSNVWTTEITKVAEPGDILMSVRAPVGPTNITNRKVCIGRGLAAIRCKDSVSPQFILYALRNIENKITGNDGAVFNSINKKMIEELPVPDIDNNQQKEIVEYLDFSFAKIDKLKENAAKNLDEAKALFQSALKDALEPKEGWEEKTLKEVSLSITDGDHMPPPKANEGIPFVTISNIDKDSNTLSMKNTFYVPEDYYNNLKEERKPRKGDLLYTVTGSFGIPVVVDSNDRFCFQRHIAMIRPNNNKITSEFLYYWCLSPNAKMIADQVATGTAQRTVSLTSLRKFIIPIPSIKEQELLVSTLITIEEKVNTLQQNYSRICDECDALKQAILRQVFE